MRLSEPDGESQTAITFPAPSTPSAGATTPESAESKPNVRPHVKPRVMDVFRTAFATVKQFIESGVTAACSVVAEVPFVGGVLGGAILIGFSFLFDFTVDKIVDEALDARVRSFKVVADQTPDKAIRISGHPGLKRAFRVDSGGETWATFLYGVAVDDRLVMLHGFAKPHHVAESEADFDAVVDAIQILAR